MTLVICDKFCINNILEQPPKKLYKQICFKTLLINQNEILKKVWVTQIKSGKVKQRNQKMRPDKNKK